MQDDLATPIRVVSARDDAIDWMAMAREGVTPHDYAQHRDPASVRTYPGKHPLWFTLRPLTGPDCIAVEAGANDAAQSWQAFRIAVDKIENFVEPGIALYPEHPIPGPAGTQRMIWDDEGLQRIANVLGMRAIYEIGGLALERAREGNARSGGVLFTPPLFLQHELDRIVFRLAALERVSVGTRSSGKPAQGQATTSSESSGAATDAHAESGGGAPAAKRRTTSRATRASKSSAPSKKRAAKG